MSQASCSAVGYCPSRTPMAAGSVQICCRAHKFHRLLILPQYSKNPFFSTHPIPLTLLTFPVSAKTVAQASRHAPLPSDPAESSPPGALARISDGRKEGDEGEAEGWRLRMVTLRAGNGVGVHRRDRRRCLSGVGVEQVALAANAVGAECLNRQMHEDRT